MLPLILIASLSFHVGECWREKKYSGLSNTYGDPIKIVEIGEKSVVYKWWVKSLDYWSSGYLIQDKEEFTKDLENNYEEIACPKSSERS